LPFLRSGPDAQLRTLLLWLFAVGSGCVNLKAPWEGVVRQDAGLREAGGMGGATDASGAGGGAEHVDVGARGGYAEGAGGMLAVGGATANGSGGVGGALIGGSSGGEGGAGGALIGGSSGGEGGAGRGGIAGYATGGTASGGASAGGVGGTTVGGAGGSPSCAAEGQRDSGICWYYGASGVSCSTTCAAHGGVSSSTAAHVGSPAQGGSLAECTRLMRLLGLGGSVNSGTRSDGVGLGCHDFPSATSSYYYWLSSPDFSNNAKMVQVRIVCGCMQ